MRFYKFSNDSAIWRRIALCVCVASMPLASAADPMHAIAMYGEPALEPGFSHLPYANPEAPKGGTIRLAETGSFDSLNPFIVKGSPPAGLAALTVETLMGRSWDEPFTVYGLLRTSQSAASLSSSAFVKFDPGTPPIWAALRK